MVNSVLSVTALYYVDDDYKSLIRFFNNRESVKTYIHDEYFGNEPWDEWNTDYRNDEIKQHLRIEEVPLVDILNELFSCVEE